MRNLRFYNVRAVIRTPIIAGQVSKVDPFYDRGSTFEQFFFPKDGVPRLQIVGMSILISKKKRFVGLGHGIVRRDAI